MKRQRTTVKVSEDVLNRQIQHYGLVSPERVKNVVWCFFKKYGSKKIKDQDDKSKIGTTLPLHDLSDGPAATSSVHSQIGQRQFTVLVDGSHEDTSSGRIQCSCICQ